MADPSLTPVAAPASATVVVATPGTKKGKDTTAAAARYSRLRRRVELTGWASAITAYRLVEVGLPPGKGKSGVLGKLLKAAAELGGPAPDVVLSYRIGRESETTGTKDFRPSAAAGPAPVAVYTLLQRLAPPPELPDLPLVRGVQAIEYPEIMHVQAFQSR